MQPGRRDGLPLDHVLFIAGRPDGEPLFERSRSRRSLQFRSNMTATEIAELWGTELALGERQQIEVGAPEPKVFAGHSGFHFGYSYATEAGLVFDGSATGAVVAGRLYLIAFFRHACAPLSGALAGGAASHPLGTGSGSIGSSRGLAIVGRSAIVWRNRSPQSQGPAPDENLSLLPPRCRQRGRA